MIFVWILNPISGPAAKIMEAFGQEVPIWSTTQGTCHRRYQYHYFMENIWI